TQDDVTKETVADYLDEELVMDDVALNYIKRYFDLSGRVMTDNNQKQALYFENGRSFLNRNGHAVGTFIQKDAHAYLLVPGPPKELTLMFDTEVRPFLETLIADDRQYIVSKTLRFFWDWRI
uniref:molybdopterin-binding protein n=1 Tax=Jeotgalibaca porci TaxID=1868793 RepID=UPI0035A07159